MHVLIIEDDRDLCNTLKMQLLSENHTADCCYTGSEALYFAMTGSYDLILLDRMLPEIDGLSILRSIRQSRIDTPVILTTALGTVDDRIDGLDCGADDYLVKPYDINELLARIRALSRRPKVFTGHQCLFYQDIRFDPDARILSAQEREEKLTKREALLMEFFLRNPEKTLKREQLFSRAWGPDGAVEEGNLDTYIYFLRKHLRSLKSRTVIRTVHGLGYCLEDSHVS